jgi:predicted enzyme related to lactoylglutathione lyase
MKCWTRICIGSFQKLYNMLAFKSTFTSFSVNDLDKANEFYSKVLGLPVTRTNEGLSVKAPDNDIFIYPKPNHQPATFTVLNFKVQDIDTAVDSLTKQGVQFEHYTGDIKTDAKGIMRGNGPTIAWFADPAGNILSVVENKS